jgi:biotin transport system permease protein
MITGLYIPGTSLFHRAPAGLKVLVLLGAGIAVVLIDDLPTLCAVSMVVVAMYVGVARLGWRPVWTSAKAIMLWLVVIAVAQVLYADLEAAAATVLRLLILVWTASLVSYTTRLDDMTAVLESGLRWTQVFGVSPQRVAFMIALTLRLIPAVFELSRGVREAQRARGVDATIVTAVTPALTRVLAHADHVAEALSARGYDRWGAPE